MTTKEVANAIGLGDIEFVLKHWKVPKSPKAFDEEWQEFGHPLVLAARAGHFSLLGPLASRGADPSHPAVRRAAIESARRGRVAVLHALAEIGVPMGGAVYQPADQTPLVAAVRNNQTKVVEFLGMQHGIDVNAGNPLYKAVEAGLVQIVRLLLQLGADVGRINDATGYAPVHVAAIHENLEIMRILIFEFHANPNQLDGEGATALFIAVVKDDLNMIRFLASNGARVNIADDYGQSPLWTAATKGNMRSVEVLVREFGASVDQINSDDATTALMIAAENGDLGIIDILLDARSTIDLASIDGETAFFMAASKCKTDALAKLAHRKADINKPRNDMITPVLIAFQNRDYRGCNHAIRFLAANLSATVDWSHPIVTAARKEDRELLWSQAQILEAQKKQQQQQQQGHRASGSRRSGNAMTDDKSSSFSSFHHYDVLPDVVDVGGYIAGMTRSIGDSISRIDIRSSMPTLAESFVLLIIAIFLVFYKLDALFRVKKRFRRILRRRKDHRNDLQLTAEEIIDKSLIDCPVCLSLPRNPILVSDGRTYCSSCCLSDFSPATKLKITDKVPNNLIDSVVKHVNRGEPITWKQLCCSLSQHSLIEPVTISTGETFNRDALIEFIEGNGLVAPKSDKKPLRPVRHGICSGIDRFYIPNLDVSTLVNLLHK